MSYGSKLCCIDLVKGKVPELQIAKKKAASGGPEDKPKKLRRNPSARSGLWLLLMSGGSCGCGLVQNSVMNGE